MTPFTNILIQDNMGFHWSRVECCLCFYRKKDDWIKIINYEDNSLYLSNSNTGGENFELTLKNKFHLNIIWEKENGSLECTLDQTMFMFSLIKTTTSRIYIIARFEQNSNTVSNLRIHLYPHLLFQLRTTALNKKKRLQRQGSALEISQMLSILEPFSISLWLHKV